ncbi:MULTISPECIES: hypothetical protein [unclassified Rhodococcus (in: high G+C Gram-positive bacteria)]|uniref:hypothetical protein n=1 Tax=unclassified Rhodococcus (in: high G+C Gram-positive bacteria) TaxID=192944 RepID=UPI0007BB9445|nr:MULTISPECIES: hypothetical protein [unclassified Rhodococcus (in: high G+C Gram-positive bacteria)]KZF00342.1 hypothetical protein A2J02_08905 [Rhodococcus sp. EPR-147]KZF01841.1 hypothetical protein A2J04_10070 [Rhodococcus sp. EPR-279]MDV7991096.1 hypothetical protein [Rhodococcus sp. IEGM 1374]OZE33254.1 hypothetical protein CH259_23035 [Rhodococcus sp. 05-2254-4]OZE43851.1 hypothetical protein CH261_15615 [Rhodococcus sp. 05-2254-3]
MSRRLSRLAGALALSCAALLAVPATAAADPAPADPLAQAIAALQGQGGASLDAATAIADSRTPVAEDANVDPFAALNAANKALTDFGITPFFYPTAAINCSATAGSPLGIVPGVAGGAAGPWPQLTAPAIPTLPFLPSIQIPELNAVDKGETMFAFVPAGIVNDSENKTGMQVAWFNVNTLQGGFADFGGLATTLADSILTNSGVPDAAKDIVRPFVIGAIDSLPAAGARAVPVETGSGTVLAAVFGTVNHKALDGSDKSCFFFPTVGMINVA